MADRVGMDPDSLEADGEYLRALGSRLLRSAQRIRSALAPYDPSRGGDATGEAIGGKYFADAEQLLIAAGSAGHLLDGMGLNVVEAARQGEADESARVEAAGRKGSPASPAGGAGGDSGTTKGGSTA